MDEPTSPAHISASAGMKMITREQRQQAFDLASSNAERAKLCSKHQGPLAELFRLNAAFLREIAE